MRIFVSYSQRSIDRAKDAESRLHGHEVLRDEGALGNFEELDTRLDLMLASVDIVLVVWNRASASSPWVNWEVSRAVWYCLFGDCRGLLFWRLDDTQLPIAVTSGEDLSLFALAPGESTAFFGAECLRRLSERQQLDSSWHGWAGQGLRQTRVGLRPTNVPGGIPVLVVHDHGPTGPRRWLLDLADALGCEPTALSVTRAARESDGTWERTTHALSRTAASAAKPHRVGEDFGTWELAHVAPGNQLMQLYRGAALWSQLPWAALVVLALLVDTFLCQHDRTLRLHSVLRAVALTASMVFVFGSATSFAVSFRGTVWSLARAPVALMLALLLGLIYLPDVRALSSICAGIIAGFLLGCIARQHSTARGTCRILYPNKRLFRKELWAPTYTLIGLVTVVALSALSAKLGYWSILVVAPLLGLAAQLLWRADQPTRAYFRRPGAPQQPGFWALIAAVLIVATLVSDSPYRHDAAEGIWVGALAGMIAFLPTYLIVAANRWKHVRYGKAMTAAFLLSSVVTVLMFSNLKFAEEIIGCFALGIASGYLTVAWVQRRRERASASS